jgi:hypothetical protein
MIAVIITCLYSVENLSTGNVEKSQSHRYFVDSVENLSTGNVEKALSGCPFVDSVENLSTGDVENYLII